MRLNTLKRYCIVIQYLFYIMNSNKLIYSGAILVSAFVFKQVSKYVSRMIGEDNDCDEYTRSFIGLNSFHQKVDKKDSLKNVPLRDELATIYKRLYNINSHEQPQPQLSDSPEQQVEPQPPGDPALEQYGSPPQL